MTPPLVRHDLQAGVWDKMVWEGVSQWQPQEVSSREKRLIYLIFGIVRNKCVLYYYFCTIPRHHSSQPKKLRQGHPWCHAPLQPEWGQTHQRARRGLAFTAQARSGAADGRLWGEIWRNNLKRWLLNIPLGELGDHPDHTQQSWIKLGAFTNSCLLHPTSSQSFNFCPNALWSAKESTWHRGWWRVRPRTRLAIAFAVRSFGFMGQNLEVYLHPIISSWSIEYPFRKQHPVSLLLLAHRFHDGHDPRENTWIHSPKSGVCLWMWHPQGAHIAKSLKTAVTSKHSC